MAGDLSEKFIKTYLQYLLTKVENGDAVGLADISIAGHFRFLKVVQKRLGCSADVPWLRYKPRSGTQLGLEAGELIALIRLTLPPDVPHLQQEHDQWLLQPALRGYPRAAHHRGLAGRPPRHYCTCRTN